MNKSILLNIRLKIGDKKIIPAFCAGIIQHELTERSYLMARGGQ